MPKVAIQNDSTADLRLWGYLWGPYIFWNPGIKYIFWIFLIQWYISLWSLFIHRSGSALKCQKGIDKLMTCWFSCHFTILWCLSQPASAYKVSIKIKSKLELTALIWFRFGLHTSSWVLRHTTDRSWQCHRRSWSASCANSWWSKLQRFLSQSQSWRSPIMSLLFPLYGLFPAIIFHYCINMFAIIPLIMYWMFIKDGVLYMKFRLT